MTTIWHQCATRVESIQCHIDTRIHYLLCEKLVFLCLRKSDKNWSRGENPKIRNWPGAWCVVIKISGIIEIKKATIQKCEFLSASRVIYSIKTTYETARRRLKSIRRRNSRPSAYHTLDFVDDSRERERENERLSKDCEW